MDLSKAYRSVVQDLLEMAISRNCAAKKGVGRKRWKALSHFT